MPRRGSGTRYLPDRDRWVAELWLRDSRGKRVVRRKFAHTQAEAQRLHRELEKRYRYAIDPGDGSQSLAAFLTSWLEGVARQRVRPSTFPSYATIVNRHLIPGIGRHRLDRLAPQHVAALLASKREEGLSARRIQYIRAVLRMALEEAVRWEIIDRNVASLVDAPRVVRPRVEAVTPERAQQIIEAVAKDRLGALYTVAIATGLRQGELLGLTWSDVDLEANVVAVRRTLTRIDQAWALSEPKTERSIRSVTLPAVASEALRAQRQRQREERLRAGDRWGVPVPDREGLQHLEDWSLVFTTATGAPLHAGVVTPRLRQLLEAAGLPRMRFHDLRHAAATLMLQAGVSPRVVQETLGHTTFNTTMTIYAHVAPELQRDAAARLDSVLAPTRSRHA